MDFLLFDSLKPFSFLAGFIIVVLIVEIGLMLVGLSSSIETDSGGDGLGLAPDADGIFTHDSAISDAEVVTAE